MNKELLKGLGVGALFVVGFLIGFSLGHIIEKAINLIKQLIG